jgi:hypothetical protein
MIDKFSGNSIMFIHGLFMNDECKDKNSRTEFREFTDRTHYICGQPGWEEVAEFTYKWIIKMR